LRHVCEHERQHRVLQHIGEVPGMVGVTVVHALSVEHLCSCFVKARISSLSASLFMSLADTSGHSTRESFSFEIPQYCKIHEPSQSCRDRPSLRPRHRPSPRSMQKSSEPAVSRLPWWRDPMYRVVHAVGITQITAWGTAFYCLGVLAH